MEHYLTIKEENITLYDNMDGPGQHNAKWNKSATEW